MDKKASKLEKDIAALNFVFRDKREFLTGGKILKISVTGHRPNKLYGYNLKDARWITLKNQFKQL